MLSAAEYLEQISLGRRLVLPLLVLFLALLSNAAVDSFPLLTHRGTFGTSSVANGSFGGQCPSNQNRRTLSRAFLSRASSDNGASSGEDEKDRESSSYSPNANGPSLQAVEKELGGYDPYKKLGGRQVDVGDPQIKVQDKERSVTSILKELAAIQQQGPQKYCILGTRHCSFLHQQIIELLAYALVLSGNHVYTSGAGGTHAATIRGALRAERQDLLTVILPQSMDKQTKESQELLSKVDDVISMPQNDEMSLDVASRICNSYLLSQTDQLISFAFHESNTVIEAAKEAKELDMLVTMLYLD